MEDNFSTGWRGGGSGGTNGELQVELGWLSRHRSPPAVHCLLTGLRLGTHASRCSGDPWWWARVTTQAPTRTPGLLLCGCGGFLWRQVENGPCRQAPESLWQARSRRDSARKAGRDSTLGFSVPCPSGSNLDESLKNTFVQSFSLMGGSVGKETACNAGDPCLIPGLGRAPGEEEYYPLQYSCLENSGNGGYSLWSLKESDTTERLTLSLHDAYSTRWRFVSWK